MTPERKILMSMLALVALVLLGAAQSLGLVVTARLLLAFSVVAVLVFLWRSKRLASGRESTPRLSVVSRVGLAPRCQASLLEIDGRTYLVVSGDGYAQIQETCKAAFPMQAFENTSLRALKEA